MDVRTRWDRLAASLLTMAGVTLIAAPLVFLLGNIGVFAGAEGEHLAGDYGAALTFVGLPLALGGLLALLAAWRLWHRRPGGGALAGLWCAIVGLGCAVSAGGSGNLLTVVKAVLLEGGTVEIDGSRVGVPGNPGGAGGSLDDPIFWVPAILLLIVVLIGGALLGGAISGVTSRQKGA